MERGGGLGGEVGEERGFAPDGLRIRKAVFACWWVGAKRRLEKGKGRGGTKKER